MTSSRNFFNDQVTRTTWWADSPHGADTPRLPYVLRTIDYDFRQFRQNIWPDSVAKRSKIGPSDCIHISNSSEIPGAPPSDPSVPGVFAATGTRQGS